MRRQDIGKLKFRAVEQDLVYMLEKEPEKDIEVVCINHILNMGLSAADKGKKLTIALALINEVYDD